MSNPFMSPNQSMPGPFGNMQQMMQQFQHFRQTFNGNPKQEVERLLQSGQMTQNQFNQLQQMASQMMQFFK